jgi:hypothetical protein
MPEQKLVWDSDYTHLIITNRHGFVKNGYEIWINGKRDPEFILMANNVTLTIECITVFEFSGEVFAGKTGKVNLKIYEYPNGVRCGELMVLRIKPVVIPER